MLICGSQIELKRLMIGLVVSEIRFTVVLLSQIDHFAIKLELTCYSLKSILSDVHQNPKRLILIEFSLHLEERTHSSWSSVVIKTVFQNRQKSRKLPLEFGQILSNGTKKSRMNNHSGEWKDIKRGLILCIGILKFSFLWANFAKRELKWSCLSENCERAIDFLDWTSFKA